MRFVKRPGLSPLHGIRPNRRGAKGVHNTKDILLPTVTVKGSEGPVKTARVYVADSRPVVVHVTREVLLDDKWYLILMIGACIGMTAVGDWACKTRRAPMTASTDRRVPRVPRVPKSASVRYEVQMISTLGRGKDPIELGRVISFRPQYKFGNPFLSGLIQAAPGIQGGKRATIHVAGLFAKMIRLLKLKLALKLASPLTHWYPVVVEWAELHATSVLTATKW